MNILDEIDTFVVVMLENRSFDHVLGYLSQPEYGGRTDVDGLPDPNAFQCENFHDNQVYKPFLAKDGRIDHDLPHERDTIHAQLDFQNGKATMGGFVKSYVARTQSVVTQPPPMGYLTPDSVPMSDFLAREFMICDRWFSPLPAGTQPNRAMAVCGTSLIENNVARPPIPNKDRLWDWLEARGVDWRLYDCGLSFNAMFDLPKMLSSNLRNFKRFSKDFADNSKMLPPVILIEPEYADSPVNAIEPNDNHPPIPMAAGEAFLREIYVALTKNPKRWKRTLLIITYDEHGGFYDHVNPDAVAGQPEDDNPAFRTYGLRVPAFVISPWVAKSSASHTIFDHTSIIKTILTKFCRSDTGEIPYMGKRVAAAMHLGSVLSEPAPRSAPQIPKSAINKLAARKAEEFKGRFNTAGDGTPGVPRISAFQEGLIAADKQLAAKVRA